MSTIELSVVLVHYRIPDLLLGAIEALEFDLGGSDLDGEFLVVDIAASCSSAGRRARGQ